MSSNETEKTSSSNSQESYERYVKNIDPATVDPLDFKISYDPACVQKLGNFGSSNARYLFDHKSHEPLTREKLKVISPKLLKIVEEIERQDAQDMRNHGKKFKHFVFSNLKSGTGGAKIIATALMDVLGMNMGYSAERKGKEVKEAEVPQVIPSPSATADQKANANRKSNEDSFENIVEAAVNDLAEGKGRARASSNGGSDMHQSDMHQSYVHQSDMLHLQQGGASDIWKKVRLHDEDELLATKYNNFFLLSSVGVFQQPLSVAMRKEILRIFNSRKTEDGDEGNSYGEKARIMVMDGGFKEGIDLFDIKYIHVFEPQATLSDQKQVIGRGTRLCGQKGLIFHPRSGWDLHVNIYDSIIPEETRFSLMDARTVFDLYMTSIGLDLRLVNLTVDMERVCIEGSVDYKLNKDIHSFKIDNSRGSSSKSDSTSSSDMVDAEEHDKMTKHIDDNFSQYKWTGVKMENLCISAATASSAANPSAAAAASSKQTLVKYTPTQDFIRHYFTPANPCKGLLLYNSVGTGKTCTAIATATSSFEKAGYTILWVTRTTLKNDIWKNMFEQVCSISIRDKIEAGVKIPDIQKERMRLLSKAWSIRPMSYKQFSNLVSAKNSMYAALVKRNGAADPLRKTFIIIDEAHKLYGDSGLSTLEQPDMGRFYEGVMRSYEVSGADSCRLLLMTATPITKSPMEIVKLLNLCKERHQRIEDDFDTFATLYLDRTGHFTGLGRARLLNDIAGYISYLNREKDARSFAQPIVKFVRVNMLETPLFREYDARIMRQILQSNLEAHKKEVETMKKSDSLSNINSKSLVLLDKVCEKYDPPLRSACKKILSKTKKNVLHYVKERKSEVKNKTKTIRDNLKNAMQDRNKIIEAIKKNVNKYKPTMEGGAKAKTLSAANAKSKVASSDEDDYENAQEIKALDNDYQKYIQSSFYNMKSKCLLQPKFKTFDSFHTVVDLRQQIKDAEALVIERQKAFKTMTTNYKKRIDVMKKQNPNDTLLRAQIMVEYKEVTKIEKEALTNLLESKRDEITELGKQIKEEKKFLLKLFKQSVKNAQKEREKYEADAKAIAQQDALLTMEIADLTVFIEDDAARDVVSKAMEEMKKDLEEMEEEYSEIVEAKAEEKARKAEEKERKAEEKEQEKERQKAEKEREKEEKERQKAEKEREKEREKEEKERKVREATQAKAEKEREKEREKEEKERKVREAAQAKAEKANEAAKTKERKAQEKEEKTRKRLEKEARRKTAKK